MVIKENLENEDDLSSQSKKRNLQSSDFEYTIE